MNAPLSKLLAAGISIRKSAAILQTNPKTVERKFSLLKRKYRKQLLKEKMDNASLGEIKLQPISIIVSVDESRRMILAFDVE